MAGDVSHHDMHEALRKLANEVSAILGMAEEEIRAVAGYTNLSVLKQRRDEALAVLRKGV